MGFHDKLAFKAYLKGHKSAEFKKAADNKASTSWLWLAATIATWYFSDSYWYLLPLVLLVISIIQSISATKTSIALEAIEKNISKESTST